MNTKQQASFLSDSEVSDGRYKRHARPAGPIQFPDNVDAVVEFIEGMGIVLSVCFDDWGQKALTGPDELRQYCLDAETIEASLYGCSVEQLRRYKNSSRINCGAVTAKGHRCRIDVGFALDPIDLDKRQGEFCRLHQRTSTAAYRRR